MSRVRTFLAYSRSNWCSFVFCTLVAILVVILFQERNRNRFVHVPDTNMVLDARTGQFCNPWPQGYVGGRDDLPRCSDLANNWRW
jgi:hypothetical protein